MAPSHHMAGDPGSAPPLSLRPDRDDCLFSIFLFPPPSHPARSEAEMRDLLGTGNALAKGGHCHHQAMWKEIPVRRLHSAAA
ncbi:hypothetical protein [Gracilimonas mengyeensis]|uniref:hypothetical protein n=1 Tax=Gracilimonas mengyeensis TaxID=1302730 RepID=UPI00115723A0|nr:hypothetical protein [Gracilimonas mengyeensis]